MDADVLQERLVVPAALPGASAAMPCSVVRSSSLQPPAPGLLLLHEVGGINASLAATAQALAREGYVVAMPNLFASGPRLRTLAQLVAGTAIRPLSNGPLAHLRAALAGLAARPDVDAARLGVIGYSMGGGYALQLACVEPSVRVVAVFCGQLPRPLGALRHASAVVASYAGRDLTTFGVATRLARELDRYRIAYDVKTYRHVPHAFYDPLGPMYDPSAAADAWARTLVFIRSRFDRPGTTGPDAP